VDDFFCGCTLFCGCARAVPEFDGLSKLAGRVSLLRLRLLLLVDWLPRPSVGCFWPNPEFSAPRLDELGWLCAPRSDCVSGAELVANFAWSASTRLELEVALPSMEAWASWFSGCCFCGWAGRCSCGVRGARTTYASCPPAAERLGVPVGYGGASRGRSPARAHVTRPLATSPRRLAPRAGLGARCRALGAYRLAAVVDKA
jgi:hypothetical protein